MENEKVKSAPLPSVRRLPLYLGFLKQLQANGRNIVSCTHLAEAFGFESVQIRKDLAITGIVGRPKVGYEVSNLIESIEGFLGWNNMSQAFLIGAGSLGSAYLGYERFKEYGVEILAAFDIDPQKIGTTIHGKDVFSLDKFSDLVQRLHVHIAILTVPALAAQDVADLVVGTGIKGILNFSPAKLDVPDDVMVEDVNLAASLAALSSRLGGANKKAASNQIS